MKRRWVLLLLAGAGVFALGMAVAAVLLTGSLPMAPRAGAGLPRLMAHQVELPAGAGIAELQPTPSPLPPEVVAASEAEYLLLRNIYHRVSPSVVNIDVAIAFGEGTTSGPVDFASGSGFVYDLAGHILTNSHVVRDADRILVTFRDGYVAEARVVGLDDFSDLAVIRVDVTAAHLVPVEMGSSDDLYVGQRVVAIGNPFGLASSLTTGVISALGRTLPSAELIDPTRQPFQNPSIIQVDAEINPGNSGGPLLDSYGRVIGVNTAIRTRTGQFQGVGFAVPASTITRIAPELIEKGRVDYSWLGISSLSPEGGFSLTALAETLNLPVTSGVLIQTITPGSPADMAGLQGGFDNNTRVRGTDVLVGGDIIVAIDGVFVDSMDELVGYLVVNTRPGDEVKLTVVRGDRTLEIPVLLGSRPD